MRTMEEMVGRHVIATLRDDTVSNRKTERFLVLGVDQGFICIQKGIGPRWIPLSRYAALEPA